MRAQIYVCLRALQSILEVFPFALGFLIKVARIPRLDRACIIGPRVDLVVDDPELICRRALRLGESSRGG